MASSAAVPRPRAVLVGNAGPRAARHGRLRRGAQPSRPLWPARGTGVQLARCDDAPRPPRSARIGASLRRVQRGSAGVDQQLAAHPCRARQLGGHGVPRAGPQRVHLPITARPVSGLSGSDLARERRRRGHPHRHQGWHADPNCRAHAARAHRRSGRTPGLGLLRGGSPAPAAGTRSGADRPGGRPAEERFSRQCRGSAVSDRLARAVRPGHARGYGVRRTRVGAARGQRARNHSGRGNGIYPGHRG